MENLNQGSGLMLVRLAIQWGGVWLAARGYGDEPLWSGLGGVAITAGGFLWSWMARRKTNKIIQAVL